MTTSRRIVDSPIGPLVLEASPRGLVAVWFGTSSTAAGESAPLDCDKQANDTGSQSCHHAESILARAAAQLDEYFSGERRVFDLPLDPGPTTPFRGRVLEELTRVPHGSTISYSELAERAGHPGAARAVGTACAANPLPIIIPCHRVVRSDGSPGQYLGGTRVKEFLLHLEAAR